MSNQIVLLVAQLYGLALPDQVRMGYAHTTGNWDVETAYCKLFPYFCDFSTFPPFRENYYLSPTSSNVSSDLIKYVFYILSVFFVSFLVSPWCIYALHNARRSYWTPLSGGMLFTPFLRGRELYIGLLPPNTFCPLGHSPLGLFPRNYMYVLVNFSHNFFINPV